MYNWFNKHLQLGQTGAGRREAVRAGAAEGTVGLSTSSIRGRRMPSVRKRLRKSMTEASDKQIAALLPKDAEGLNEYRRVVGTALRVMIGDKLPQAGGVQEIDGKLVKDEQGLSWTKLLLGRRGEGDRIPAIFLRGPEFDGTVIVWVHPAGKSSLMHEGKLVRSAEQILHKKAAILAVDVFMTGEFQGAKAPPVDPKYAGFTFGYNRCLLANRVHDMLTAVAYARDHQGTQKIH